MAVHDLDAYMAFMAANVRALRIDRGLTQLELAERASVDHVWIHRIESGAGNPTAKVLCALAIALDVLPGQLFQQTEPQSRPPGRPKKKKEE